MGNRKTFARGQRIEEAGCTVLAIGPEAGRRTRYELQCDCGRMITVQHKHFLQKITKNNRHCNHCKPHSATGLPAKLGPAPKDALVGGLITPTMRYAAWPAPARSAGRFSWMDRGWL